jgi:hypothetical protein
LPRRVDDDNLPLGVDEKEVEHVAATEPIQGDRVSPTGSSATTRKEFTEPVALSSTQPTDRPLPRRALKLSFDLGWGHWHVGFRPQGLERVELPADLTVLAGLSHALRPSAGRSHSLRAGESRGGRHFPPSEREDPTRPARTSTR